jgi:hypothetical protein
LRVGRVPIKQEWRGDRFKVLASLKKKEARDTLSTVTRGRSLECLIECARAHLEWVIGFGALGYLTPAEYTQQAGRAAAARSADDGLS